MNSRNLGTGSFKQSIEHERNKLSYAALTDLFLTIVATVTFVVLVTGRPFNTLVLYMLMNLVHFILIPFTFSLCKRNIHSQSISYYIVFLAMFLTLDCISLVIRCAAFSFCEKCTESAYLASTLIPFFLVILYILLDIWMAYCAYSLRSLCYIAEKATAWQEVGDEEALVYTPRNDAPQPLPRQMQSAMSHERIAPRQMPSMSGQPIPPFTFPPQEMYGYFPEEPSPVPMRYSQVYHHSNFAEPNAYYMGGDLAVYQR